ncbi:unnamed protein product [Phytophthora fragariaefolia]|uniref:Unnamed protein product n=1 Tax=Phytophthora fragariaefolia TaxID=1490495 RepID=A0A9W6YD79_9STRA|nr:unnamed protein product [Phytophthora fragariaefolia]
MSNTKVGRIYKILSTQSDHVYVGSTFNTIRDRFHQHKEDYSKWLNGKHGEVSIYSYFKQFGVDNFKMILIKEYEVVDRTHLEAYETMWMSKLTCVNKVIPFRIPKLSDKAKYERNKEHILNRANQYREIHRDAINEQKRVRYHANKERLNRQSREYHEANKQRLNAKKKEKITCGCGTTHTHGVLARHLRTAKHQQWQASQ